MSRGNKGDEKKEGVRRSVKAKVTTKEREWDIMREILDREKESVHKKKKIQRKLRVTSG